jgi:hypothetical protein
LPQIRKKEERKGIIIPPTPTGESMTPPHPTAEKKFIVVFLLASPDQKLGRFAPFGAGP